MRAFVVAGLAGLVARWPLLVMAAVGEVGAVVGVVADLLVVSADPNRSTKQTAMATTTARSRAAHIPVSSIFSRISGFRKRRT
jgi:hypothetical protein